MKAFLATFAWTMSCVLSAAAQTEQFPKNNAVDVNPDTRLRLVFSSPPPLGNSGKIKIYDASNDSLADELDLSIPPGPRNTRTPAPYDTLKYSSVPDTVFTVSSPDMDTSHVYQKNYVGGTKETDARHFFPVLMDENVATVSPHNSRLAYGKTYYVLVDAEVFPFSDGSFHGIADKSAWTFTTKSAPAAETNPLVVSADGTGDFSTVQAAIDFIPDNSANSREIFIKTGVYEEIVVLRNKQNLTLHGENRENVIVRYANNGVFNSVGRYEFTLAGSMAVNLINFTIQVAGKDENPAQAEALYVKGDKYQTHNMSLLGSGDALQIQASTRIYLSKSKVRGYGDNFLSYGAAFFKACELVSTYGPHGWPRNPETNHGDVFLNSTFSLEGVGTAGDGHCSLARSPMSGVSFPFAEFVLISCKLQGIMPEGWGAAGPDYTNVHFWEYNSVNLSDGKPVDVSKRVSYSRQLTMDKDAETIANYSNPTFVLAGWTPELAPVILTQLPDSLAVPVGGSAELHVLVAAEPAATFQWFKDGQALDGETAETLKLSAATAGLSGKYTVSAENSVGKVSSSEAEVVVGAAGAQAGAGGMATQGGAGGAGLGAQAGSVGTASGSAGRVGMQTSSATGSAGSSSGVASVGTAGPQAGAPGATAGSAGTSPQSAQKSSGGCHVGPERGTGDSWPMLLAAAFLAARRTRQRPGVA